MRERPRSHPVAVTGAGGFIGRRLVRRLRGEGSAVRAVVRSRADAEEMRAAGGETAIADVRDPSALRAAFAGARAVVHLVAVLRERGEETYEAVNHIGARNAAAAAREAGVERFVHLSAVGAGPQATRYLRSKWLGEERVRDADVPFVIFRSSIVIGPGGGAAAQFADVVRFGPWYPFVLLLGGRGIFARLASLVPLVPVLGDGRYRQMPVALDDLLTALVGAVDRADVLGRTFEIGGPEVLTYNEIVDVTARLLALRRRRAHLPTWAARAVVQAFRVLPNPPITEEERRALLDDNLCDPGPVVRTFDLRLQQFVTAMREALEPPRAKG